MARSISTIYQEIITAGQTNLPELTNNRPTSIWNRIAFVFATVTNTLEQIFDQYQADLIDITNQAAYGSADWLKRKAYEFQYSSTDPQVISWVPANYRYEYPAVNDNYRIVTQASVQTVTGNQVRVKAAKGQIGSLIKLDAAEKASLVSYFSTICPAGQYIDLISEDGDQISMEIDIYFEGQIPQTYIQSQATDAITNYINGVAFDGVIYAASVVDAVQSIGGVINCILIDNGGTVASAVDGYIVTTWDTSVTLYSGYTSAINLTLNLYPQ